MRAVLFDLGGTLVHYFDRTQQAAVLRAALDEARRALPGLGWPDPGADAVEAAFAAENREEGDYRVRPLDLRLIRALDPEVDDPVKDAAGEPDCQTSGGLSTDPSLFDRVMPMVRAFMGPIFARARLEPGAVRLLKRLRDAGVRTAIVSNTPWGSPGHLWREELQRLGLLEAVDEAVFCTDAGWRKPAAPIFHLAMQRLGVTVQDCLFVGDDPRWDIAGPQAIGMASVLLDPGNDHPGTAATRVENLEQLWPVIRDFIALVS